ncbi:toprim domain-containing protein [Streptomyces sp. NBC_00470]|uniref:toprim domain-containing protein n=1 Tax=Streptomyces sp. NBC_00470 TaxID=2975753 RepID=UPI0030E589CB
MEDTSELVEHGWEQQDAPRALEQSAPAHTEWAKEDAPPALERSTGTGSQTQPADERPPTAPDKPGGAPLSGAIAAPDTVDSHEGGAESQEMPGAAFESGDEVGIPDNGASTAGREPDGAFANVGATRKLFQQGQPSRPDDDHTPLTAVEDADAAPSPGPPQNPESAAAAWALRGVLADHEFIELLGAADDDESFARWKRQYMHSYGEGRGRVEAGFAAGEAVKYKKDAKYFEAGFADYTVNLRWTRIRSWVRSAAIPDDVLSLLQAAQDADARLRGGRGEEALFAAVDELGVARDLIARIRGLTDQVLNRVAQFMETVPIPAKGGGKASRAKESATLFEESATHLLDLSGTEAFRADLDQLNAYLPAPGEERRRERVPLSELSAGKVVDIEGDPVVITEIIRHRERCDIIGEFRGPVRPARIKHCVDLTEDADPLIALAPLLPSLRDLTGWPPELNTDVAPGPLVEGHPARDAADATTHTRSVAVHPPALPVPRLPELVWDEKRLREFRKASDKAQEHRPPASGHRALDPDDPYTEFTESLEHQLHLLAEQPPERAAVEQAARDIHDTVTDLARRARDYSRYRLQAAEGDPAQLLQLTFEPSRAHPFLRVATNAIMRAIDTAEAAVTGARAKARVRTALAATVGTPSRGPRDRSFDSALVEFASVESDEDHMVAELLAGPAQWNHFADMAARVEAATAHPDPHPPAPRFTTLDELRTHLADLSVRPLPAIEVDPAGLVRHELRGRAKLAGELADDPTLELTPDGRLAIYGTVDSGWHVVAPGSADQIVPWSVKSRRHALRYAALLARLTDAENKALAWDADDFPSAATPYEHPGGQLLYAWIESNHNYFRHGFEDHLKLLRGNSAAYGWMEDLDLHHLSGFDYIHPASSEDLRAGDEVMFLFDPAELEYASQVVAHYPPPRMNDLAVGSGVVDENGKLVPGYWWPERDPQQVQRLTMPVALREGVRRPRPGEYALHEGLPTYLPELAAHQNRESAAPAASAVPDAQPKQPLAATATPAETSPDPVDEHPKQPGGGADASTPAAVDEPSTEPSDDQGFSDMLFDLEPVTTGEGPPADTPDTAAAVQPDHARSPEGAEVGTASESQPLLPNPSGAEAAEDAADTARAASAGQSGGQEPASAEAGARGRPVAGGAPGARSTDSAYEREEREEEGPATATERPVSPDDTTDTPGPGESGTSTPIERRESGLRIRDWATREGRRWAVVDRAQETIWIHPADAEPFEALFTRKAHAEEWRDKVVRSPDLRVPAPDQAAPSPAAADSGPAPVPVLAPTLGTVIDKKTQGTNQLVKVRVEDGAGFRTLVAWNPIGGDHVRLDQSVYISGDLGAEVAHNGTLETSVEGGTVEGEDAARERRLATPPAPTDRSPAPANTVLSAPSNDPQPEAQGHVSAALLRQLRKVPRAERENRWTEAELAPREDGTRVQALLRKSGEWVQVAHAGRYNLRDEFGNYHLLEEVLAWRDADQRVTLLDGPQADRPDGPETPAPASQPVPKPPLVSRSPQSMTPDELEAGAAALEAWLNDFEAQDTTGAGARAVQGRDALRAEQERRHQQQTDAEQFGGLEVFRQELEDLTLGAPEVGGTRNVTRQGIHLGTIEASADGFHAVPDGELLLPGAKAYASPEGAAVALGRTVTEAPAAEPAVGAREPVAVQSPRFQLNQEDYDAEFDAAYDAVFDAALEAVRARVAEKDEDWDEEKVQKEAEKAATKEAKRRVDPNLFLKAHLRLVTAYKKDPDQHGQRKAVEECHKHGKPEAVTHLSRGGRLAIISVAPGTYEVRAPYLLTDVLGPWGQQIKGRERANEIANALESFVDEQGRPFPWDMPNPTRQAVRLQALTWTDQDGHDTRQAILHALVTAGLDEPDGRYTKQYYESTGRHLEAPAPKRKTAPRSEDSDVAAAEQQDPSMPTADAFRVTTFKKIGEVAGDDGTFWWKGEVDNPHTPSHARSARTLLKTPVLARMKDSDSSHGADVGWLQVLNAATGEQLGKNLRTTSHVLVAAPLDQETVTGPASAGHRRFTSLGQVRTHLRSATIPGLSPQRRGAVRKLAHDKELVELTEDGQFAIRRTGTTFELLPAGSGLPLDGLLNDLYLPSEVSRDLTLPPDPLGGLHTLEEARAFAGRLTELQPPVDWSDYKLGARLSADTIARLNHTLLEERAHHDRANEHDSSPCDSLWQLFEETDPGADAPRRADRLEAGEWIWLGINQEDRPWEVIERTATDFGTVAITLDDESTWQLPRNLAVPDLSADIIRGADGQAIGLRLDAEYVVDDDIIEFDLSPDGTPVAPGGPDHATPDGTIRVRGRARMTHQGGAERTLLLDATIVDGTDLQSAPVEVLATAFKLPAHVCRLPARTTLIPPPAQPRPVAKARPVTRPMTLSQPPTDPETSPPDVDSEEEAVAEQQPTADVPEQLSQSEQDEMVDTHEVSQHEPDLPAPDEVSGRRGEVPSAEETNAASADHGQDTTAEETPMARDSGAAQSETPAEAPTLTTTHMEEAEAPEPGVSQSGLELPGAKAGPAPEDAGQDGDAAVAASPTGEPSAPIGEDSSPDTQQNAGVPESDANDPGRSGSPQRPVSEPAPQQGGPDTGGTRPQPASTDVTEPEQVAAGDDDASPRPAEPYPDAGAYATAHAALLDELTQYKSWLARIPQAREALDSVPGPNARTAAALPRLLALQTALLVGANNGEGPGRGLVERLAHHVRCTQLTMARTVVQRVAGTSSLEELRDLHRLALDGQFIAVSLTEADDLEVGKYIERQAQQIAAETARTSDPAEQEAATAEETATMAVDSDDDSQLPRFERPGEIPLMTTAEAAPRLHELALSLLQEGSTDVQFVANIDGDPVYARVEHDDSSGPLLRIGLTPANGEGSARTVTILGSELADVAPVTLLTAVAAWMNASDPGARPLLAYAPRPAGQTSQPHAEQPNTAEVEQPTPDRATPTSQPATVPIDEPGTDSAPVPSEEEVAATAPEPSPQADSGQPEPSAMADSPSAPAVDPTPATAEPAASTTPSRNHDTQDPPAATQSDPEAVQSIEQGGREQPSTSTAERNEAISDSPVDQFTALAQAALTGLGVDSEATCVLTAPGTIAITLETTGNHSSDDEIANRLRDTLHAAKRQQADRQLDRYTLDIKFTGQPGQGTLQPASQAVSLPRERLVAANTAAAQIFAERLQSDDNAHLARTYLTERDIPAEVQQEWILGYAPSDRHATPRRWDVLVHELRGQGFSDEELVQAGLAKVSSRGTLIDVFEDRIMFPIHDEGGDIVGFSGRRIDRPGETKEQAKERQQQKYFNTANGPLFTKGELLFGIYHPAQATALAYGQGPLVTVEGFTDVLAVCRAATTVPLEQRPVVAAPMGTAFTDRQLTVLRGLDTDTPRHHILFQDADESGAKVMIDKWDELVHLASSTDVTSAPDAKDAAQLWEDGIKADGDGATPVLRVLQQSQPLLDAVVEAIMWKNASTAERANHAFEDGAAYTRQRDIADVAKYIHEAIQQEHPGDTAALDAAAVTWAKRLEREWNLPRYMTATAVLLGPGTHDEEYENQVYEHAVELIAADAEHDFQNASNAASAPRPAQEAPRAAAPEASDTPRPAVPGQWPSGAGASRAPVSDASETEQPDQGGLALSMILPGPVDGEPVELTDRTTAAYALHTAVHDRLGQHAVEALDPGALPQPLSLGSIHGIDLATSGDDQSEPDPTIVLWLGPSYGDALRWSYSRLTAMTAPQLLATVEWKAAQTADTLGVPLSEPWLDTVRAVIPTAFPAKPAAGEFVDLLTTIARDPELCSEELRRRADQAVAAYLHGRPDLALGHLAPHDHIWVLRGDDNTWIQEEAPATEQTPEELASGFRRQAAEFREIAQEAEALPTGANDQQGAESSDAVELSVAHQGIHEAVSALRPYSTGLPGMHYQDITDVVTWMDAARPALRRLRGPAGERLMHRAKASYVRVLEGLSTVASKLRITSLSAFLEDHIARLRGQTSDAAGASRSLRPDRRLQDLAHIERDLERRMAAPLVTTPIEERVAARLDADPDANSAREREIWAEERGREMEERGKLQEEWIVNRARWRARYQQLHGQAPPAEFLPDNGLIAGAPPLPNAVAAHDLLLDRLTSRVKELRDTDPDTREQTNPYDPMADLLNGVAWAYHQRLVGSVPTGTDPEGPIPPDQLRQAALTVTTQQTASPLALRHAMNISADRADHLLHQLEQHEILGPYRSDEPRAVLARAADISTLLNPPSTSPSLRKDPAASGPAPSSHTTTPSDADDLDAGKIRALADWVRAARAADRSAPAAESGQPTPTASPRRPAAATHKAGEAQANALASGQSTSLTPSQP